MACLLTWFAAGGAFELAPPGFSVLAALAVLITLAALAMIAGLVLRAPWRHATYATWAAAIIAAAGLVLFPVPRAPTTDDALALAIVVGIVIVFGLALFVFDPPAT